MTRASIREEETTTIARFLSGLNLKIRDKVELFPYRDLNDLIQLCIKVEQQNLRKISSRKENSYSNSYPKRDHRREREESVSKEKPKETPNSVGKDMPNSQPHSRDIQCFKCLGRRHIASKCPNRRIMILRGRDEYSSQEDESSGGEEKENSEGAYDGIFMCSS